MMERNLTFFAPLYEGEGDGQNQGGDTPPATPPAAKPPATPPAADGNGEPKFSPEVQEHINRVLAREKRQSNERTKKALDELNAIKSRANLTEQERLELNNRVETLSNELLTKEELRKKREKEMADKHSKELAEWKAKAQKADARYTESTIRRSLQDAAVSNDAYAPSQVVAILRPRTRLVEELDESGKPTGSMVAKTKLDTVDSDGKPITLDLSPAETVKKMKEMEEYLNLFRGEGVGGVGLRSQPGGPQPDIAELARDPERYRKARAEGRIKF